MWTIHDGRVHSVKYKGNDRHINSIPKKRHDGRVRNHFQTKNVNLQYVKSVKIQRNMLTLT